MKLRLKSALWALESAYWLNYCGDWKVARRMVLKITNEIMEEPFNGKRK